MNLDKIKNIEIDPSFDEEKYLKNNPEALHFAQPLCKKNNIPERVRLFLHYMFCNPHVKKTQSQSEKRFKYKKRKKKELIVNYKKIKNKTIINCYYDDCHSGFGDFIRGSCYLHENFGNIPNVIFSMDFSNHAIGEFISSQNKLNVNNSEIIDIEKQVTDIEKQKSQYFTGMKRRIVKLFNRSEDQEIKLFTNCCDLSILQTKEQFTLTTGAKTFIKNNLIFSEEVLSAYKEIKLPKDYTLMHFRLGDMHTVYSKNSKINTENINNQSFVVDYDKTLKLIIDEHKKNNSYVLVLSDSNRFKEFVLQNIENKLKKHIIVVHTNSQHSSNNPGSVDDHSVDMKSKKSNMFFVALDLIIIMNSSKIISSSVYPWGSGFCFWLAKVYDIPITFEKI